MNAPLTLNAWLRWEVIRRELRRLPGHEFLEIGCGAGALGARLCEIYGYTGYEPDPESSRIARSRIGGRGEVINAFLPEPPTRRFDLAGAFEVLEHIEDDVGALRTWRSWLHPGGHLLLSVPAGPSRFGPADHNVGHFRRYTRASLAEAIDSADLELVGIWSTGFPLGYLLEAVRNRIAARPGAAAARIESRTAASGRWLQPRDRLGAATRLATLPFRIAQRPFYRTSLGTGLVALARRPLA